MSTSCCRYVGAALVAALAALTFSSLVGASSTPAFKDCSGRVVRSHDDFASHIRVDGLSCRRAKTAIKGDHNDYGFSCQLHERLRGILWTCKRQRQELQRYRFLENSR